MAIVERIKNICLKPKTEWEAIAPEETSRSSLFTGYAIFLAAIPSIAGFIGGSIIGRSLPVIGSYRVPILAGLVTAVFTYVMALVGVFVVSLIINALAPSFGGEKNGTQALKLAVYSYTPAWIAGVLQILPVLGVLALLAGLYGLYLLYLGLPRLMKCPQEKAIGYTAVVVVCAIVLSVIIVVASTAIVRAGMFGAHAVPHLAGGRASSSVEFDKDSPMGKLQALGEAMEESNKKMEAAKKRGDRKAEAAAAMDTLGALLGGGKRVDPVGIDQLKPLVPDTFADLPKLSSKAERSGVVGLMVAKASATYGDRADKRVSLDISDTGGAAGLLSVASWVNVQTEKEDDDGFERTMNVDGRMVHERSSKRNGRNEFTVVLASRFVVSAKGRGVDLDTLKSAVNKLDLAKLEGMKDVGVRK
ncbi:MAG: YIP1 family protein [Deltaproteobacteria bacterium]|nr:YIP1 family protein [Deltaproteobacteria bacterium]